MIGSIFFITKILPVISFLIIAIVVFIFCRKFNNYVLMILGGVLVFLLCFLIVIPAVKKHRIEQDFESFDLSELMRDEFIVQTMDFNKFVVYGTFENEGTIPEKILDDHSPFNFFKYRDELKVYHVNGRAEVIFNEIDRLRAVEEDFDYEKGICRFLYDSPDFKNAFKVKVYIENIEVVQDFESEKFMGIDLKKPDKTGAEIIEETRAKLEKEFKEQLTQGVNKKNITNSDVYESFIIALEKMVNNYGYTKVEVAFETEKE